MFILKTLRKKIDELILSNGMILKLLIGFFAFLMLFIIIYTARNLEDVKIIMKHWGTFTFYFLIIGLSLCWLVAAFLEKIGRPSHPVFTGLFVIILLEWLLFMVCAVVAGSVIVVIETFGF